jgi:Uma2 family endonuclease
MNAPFKPIVTFEPRPIRFSSAEFLEMVAAGVFRDRKVELVDGEIIELPPPGSQHGLFQAQLIVALHAAVADAHGLVLMGETGVDLYEGTLRACDLAIVRVAADQGTMLAPDQVLLAVEIAVTTLSRDLGEKAVTYAKAGIAALWVVDPEARVTHVLLDPHEGAYRARSVVRFGEPLAVPGAGTTITID